jgi:hypothetical protein
MSELELRLNAPAEPRWTYDDPSGVPDWSLVVPEDLREEIAEAAAREGLTPAAWLAAVVARAGLARRAHRPSPVM